MRPTIQSELRALYSAMNNPPSPELPSGADVLLRAADEIERLRKEDEANKDIIGMLRAQLRILGHIPCVVESDEVGKAEYKMRAAARGHAN